MSDYFDFDNEKNIPERDESRPISARHVEPEKEEREVLSRQSTYASASLETSSIHFSQKDRTNVVERDRINVVERNISNVAERDLSNVAERDRTSFGGKSMTSQPISPPVASSPKKTSQLTKEQLSRELRSHLEEIELRRKEENKIKKKSSRDHSTSAAIDLKFQEEKNHRRSSGHSHVLSSQEFEEQNQRRPPIRDHPDVFRSQEFEENIQRRSSARDHSRDFRSQEFEDQRRSSARPNDLRSQLEEFQFRHKEDLKIIKQCNLDIVLPEPSVDNNGSKSKKSHPKASNDEKMSLQSSTIRKEIRPQTRSRPSGSSEAESQPPVLHFADSPEPDPFNFMSSVKRKLQDQNREFEFRNESADVNLVSESMALSEGPLSITITSSRSSKSCVDKKVSTVEKESSRQRREKSFSGERQNNDKQQQERLVSFSVLFFQ